MNLGRLFLRKGELDRAETFVDTAISLYAQVGVSANPNVIDAYWLRGMLHLEQGNAEHAMEWSKRNYAMLREELASRMVSRPSGDDTISLSVGWLWCRDRSRKLHSTSSAPRRFSGQIGRQPKWHAQATGAHKLGFEPIRPPGHARSLWRR